MEMDWESLLDELWDYVAPDSNELETKIRSCLKGHSSEGLLQAISFLIAQGQHTTARTLLREFLTNHQATDEIQRRFELILYFKKKRALQAPLIKSTQRGEDLLPKEPNDLLTPGKLKETKGRLFKAADTNKGLQAPHLQSASEISPAEPESLPLTTDQASVAEVDGLLSYIQQEASGYEPLSQGCWWEEKVSTAEPEVAGDLESLPVSREKRADNASSATANAPMPGSPLLAKSSDSSDEIANVKTFKKPDYPPSTTCSSGLSLTEPSDPDSLPSISSVPEELYSVGGAQEGITSHNGDNDEASILADLGLETSTTFQTNMRLEEPAEGFDLDHELDDLTVIEQEAGYVEPSIISDGLCDFGDGAFEQEDEFAAYAFDPDEVFENEKPVVSESEDWLADKLSREDRARQKAAEFIGKANWPISALPLVQQIFVVSGWASTRLALERELKKGLTAEELALAEHIKTIWSENDLYWIAFDRSGDSRLSYSVLSWPAALKIVRSFDALPQEEEIEVLLENLFSCWYENRALCRVFKAFARYLWFRFTNLEEGLPVHQPFGFGDPHELPAEEYSDLGLSDALEIEKNAILNAYGVIQFKHHFRDPEYLYYGQRS